MNKAELLFVISHLKQAIYELEVANKLIDKSVDVELIDKLKETLEHTQKLSRECK